MLDISHSSKFSASSAPEQIVATIGVGFGHAGGSAVAKKYTRNAGLQMPGDLR